MPDDPAAEGPPAGRSDPNSGLGSKIGPLSLGMWLLVGGGILVAVWLIKNQTSGPTSTDVTGSAGSTGGSAGGVSDTTTLAGLQQAMQDQANQLAADAAEIKTLEDEIAALQASGGGSTSGGVNQSPPANPPPRGQINQAPPANPPPRTPTGGYPAPEFVSTTRTTGGLDTNSITGH